MVCCAWPCTLSCTQVVVSLYCVKCTLAFDTLSHLAFLFVVTVCLPCTFVHHLWAMVTPGHQCQGVISLSYLMSRPIAAEGALLYPGCMIPWFLLPVLVPPCVLVSGLILFISGCSFGNLCGSKCPSWICLTFWLAPIWV